MEPREHNFDGLVGPTHNYGGLSLGNLASTRHGNQVSHPREAALQGLEKMRYVASLGVGQAVLPPHPRPSLSRLRKLGFHGSDEEVLAQAAASPDQGQLLRLCASAAAMWTANAATVAPSEDTADGRLHLTVANLRQMFHRELEGETTFRILRAIFADPRRFAVHEPLPGGLQLSDEGAANHTRLKTPGHAAVHLFAWGRKGFDASSAAKFPARQTLEASQAVARLHRLEPTRCLFPRQSPEGIEAGAFHTDVLGVGNGGFLMMHERAFVDGQTWIETLRGLLGEGFSSVVASERELSSGDAVASYVFNSQLLSLPDGTMAVVAPTEARDTPAAKAFLDRVMNEANPVAAVHYLDLRQSMNNGGGPACLRLRVPLTDEERGAIGANVLWTPALHQSLTDWVKRHYRDRLQPSDLSDPALARESMAALDELTQILSLGSVYDFQR